MSTKEVADVIRAHIIETCPPEKRDREFSNGSSLVATGILDSVGVFTLVALLEERYGIAVPDEELTWTNFESVDGIAAFVESRLTGARLT